MAKQSRHNIGIVARGTKVKTYYDLIAHDGRVTEEEEIKRLKKGIKQIQNIVHKRIKRLTAYEQKTSITSPALKELRGTGFGLGVSTRGDVEMLRESYKAGVRFLSNETSTIKGQEEHKKRISDALREAGWKKEITNQQYERYKALAKKFYSEQAKMVYYLTTRMGMSREKLRKTANKEIMKLMRRKKSMGLDELMDLAEQRIDQMYEKAMLEREKDFD